MEDNKQPIIFEQSREMSNRKHILVIDDDPETLQRRVMEEAEWKLLSQAVTLYCSGRLSVHGSRVVISEEKAKV